MFQASRPRYRNRLLAALPREEQERLTPYLESFTPVLKETFYAPDEPIQFAYFLESGIASMLTEMEDGAAVEVGTIGNEGMVGIQLILGATCVPGRAILQVSGDKALRMSAEHFKRRVTPDTALYSLLRRYLQTLFNQVAQSAACMAIHSLEERFCRCLLLTQDRMNSDEFLLTQEFLSQMLVVKRPSVNEVASMFQQAGIIRYSRGKMTILDRSGLEAASCGCYEVIKRDFERLLNGNGNQT